VKTITISQIVRRSFKYQDLLTAPGNASRIAILPGIMETETLAKLDKLEHEVKEMTQAERYRISQGDC